MTQVFRSFRSELYRTFNCELRRAGILHDDHDEGTHSLVVFMLRVGRKLNGTREFGH